MGTEITLTIPDHIYQQVQQIAESEKRPIADIINHALSYTFPSVHVHPRRAQMEQETAVFWQMHPQLLVQYPNQYIAIFQGQVVDHDQDRLALIARIDEKYTDAIVLIKKVTDEPESDLHFRSPRLLPK
jgi:hypothetical protein